MRTLLPDPIELLTAENIGRFWLRRAAIHTDDPILARRLEDAGCAASCRSRAHRHRSWHRQPAQHRNDRRGRGRTGHSRRWHRHRQRRRPRHGTRLLGGPARHRGHRAKHPALMAAAMPTPSTRATWPAERAHPEAFSGPRLPRRRSEARCHRTADRAGCRVSADGVRLRGAADRVLALTGAG